MTSTPAPLIPSVIPLENRQIIEVSGNDRYDFIQGLITNDIELLKSQDAIYACMLTPQGKFLFEFFIFEQGDTLYLDTEKDRAADCLKHLSMYKLRAKVDIILNETVRCYACFDDFTDSSKSFTHFQDPRHKEIGYRLYAESIESAKLLPFSNYDQKRIMIGLPDGARDLTPERSTMAEGRIDEFCGVSFKKGCYVGQEVTARMHHRGLTKKKLMPLKRTDGQAWQAHESIIINDKEIGIVTSYCENYALALLKCEYLETIHSQNNPFILT